MLNLFREESMSVSALTVAQRVMSREDILGGAPLSLPFLHLDDNHGTAKQLPLVGMGVSVHLATAARAFARAMQLSALRFEGEEEAVAVAKRIRARYFQFCAHQGCLALFNGWAFHELAREASIQTISTVLGHGYNAVRTTELRVLTHTIYQAAEANVANWRGLACLANRADAALILRDESGRAAKSGAGEKKSG
jgi:hypothetical protein